MPPAVNPQHNGKDFPMQINYEITRRVISLFARLTAGFFFSLYSKVVVVQYGEQVSNLDSKMPKCDLAAFAALFQQTAQMKKAEGDTSAASTSKSAALPALLPYLTGAVGAGTGVMGGAVVREFAPHLAKPLVVGAASAGLSALGAHAATRKNDLERERTFKRRRLRNVLLAALGAGAAGAGGAALYDHLSASKAEALDTGKLKQACALLFRGR